MDATRYNILNDYTNKGVINKRGDLKLNNNKKVKRVFFKLLKL